MSGSNESSEAWLNTEEDTAGKPEFITEDTATVGMSEDITEDATGKNEDDCTVSDVHMLEVADVQVTPAAGAPDGDVEGGDTEEYCILDTSL